MKIYYPVLAVAFELMAFGTSAPDVRAQAPRAEATKGEKTVLNTAKIMAFAATSDANRSKTFYEKTLGLRLVADEQFALVFHCNGTQLRIQKVQKVQPPPFTVLGWEVPNIRETLTDLGQRGVTFERFGFFPQDDLGIWTADDQTKVAWFKDPDGNLLSITQFK